MGVQSAPEFVESQDDDYNMSAENLLAELNGKSWKSLEAEFNQLIQNEDSDTQMATLFSFQKMAKMDPEELGQLTMDAMHKDQRAELEQMYTAPTPRWSHAQAGIAGAHTPMSLTGGVLFVK